MLDSRSRHEVVLDQVEECFVLVENVQVGECCVYKSGPQAGVVVVVGDEDLRFVDDLLQ